MKDLFKVVLLTIGMLSIFSCEDDKENQLPSAANLMTPAKEATDQELKPVFTWEKSIDPDNDAISYAFYLGDSEELTSEHKIKENIIENTYTLETSLKGHTKYYWKVVASDEEDASAESAVFSFTTKNAAPQVSGLEFPENGAIDVAQNLTLKWSAEDLDGDVLKYTVYLAETNEFTEENMIASDLAETEKAVELKGHTKYFWKIVAVDSEGQKVESDVANFTTLNSIPSAPTCVGPAADRADISQNVKLEWEASTDKDQDKVVYDLYLTTGETLDGGLPFKKDLDVTEMSVSVRGNTTYKWKVVARDEFEGECSSEIFTFTTANTVPTAAVIQSAEEAIVNTKVNVTINWEASVDPDQVKNSDDVLQPEPLNYKLYVSIDETIDEADLKSEEISDTKFIVTGLKFSTKYFVKVVTNDTNSGEAQSEVFEFTTQKQPKLLKGEWTDARDGKIYKTITINGKTWLAENLAYLPYVMDATKNEKVCSVYGMDVTDATTVDELKAHANYSNYGVVYSAYALEDLAPEGWHVATDEDWKEIEKVSGMTDDEVNAESYRGATTKHFLATDKNWAESVETTNELLFNIVAGGYFGKKSTYSNELLFKGENSYVYYWTSTSEKGLFGAESYYNRAFSGTKAGVGRSKGKLSNNRMYVRLVKDSE